MSSGNSQSIDHLRDALRVSPDNIPLRLALAEALSARNEHAEAEAEFRAGLQRAPHLAAMKLGLARAFFAQGKKSHASVALEDLTSQPDAPGTAFVLHARVLASMGEINQAVEQYRAGVSRDATAMDLELANRLGIDAQPEEELQEGKLLAGWESPEQSLDSIDLERPKIDFSHVGGMESLKEEIRMKIIYPITHAEMFKAYGKSIGGGILLYGPPGCGKTHLARATAGEIKAGFISVGINDILEMWIGNSERNLHELFQKARRNKPCVLFFDEVDALGASRSDLRTSAGRHLINQFLAELDGAESNNDGILVLGATNAPWHLDTAFRRPGRFDRILFVPPPDEEARAGILRVLVRGKPCEDLDFSAIARKTDGFSGADLKGLLDQTVESKLREAMKSGLPSPMRTRDFLTTAATTRASAKEWFAAAKNYALYSNQGGIYDDILKYMKL